MSITGKSYRLNSLSVDINVSTWTLRFFSLLTQFKHMQIGQYSISKLSKYASANTLAELIWIGAKMVQRKASTFCSTAVISCSWTRNIVFIQVVFTRRKNIWVFLSYSKLKYCVFQFGEQLATYVPGY